MEFLLSLAVNFITIKVLGIWALRDQAIGHWLDA
jgi:hypothetical protein